MSRGRRIKIVKRTPPKQKLRGGGPRGTVVNPADRLDKGFEGKKKHESTGKKNRSELLRCGHFYTSKVKKVKDGLMTLFHPLRYCEKGRKSTLDCNH